MSNAPPPSNSDQPDNRYQLLAEYEDEIINEAELIDVCLEENLVKADRNVRRSLVIDDLSSVLYVEIENDEKAHNVAQVIMDILSDHPIQVQDNILSASGSRELVRVIKKLSSKYGAESTIPNRIARQGANYWSDMYLDIVRRAQSGAIGMNYRIVMNHAKETHLSMDLNSNMIFCANLLNAHIQAVDEFGESAIEQINTETLERLHMYLDHMTEQIEEHESQSDGQDNDHTSN